MTERIASCFKKAADEGRSVLGVFVTAGDPSEAESDHILDQLVENGADFVELGMPFSDPMADGPAIQAASLRVIGVMTNTPAVDAYRGAGRPEANYLMERLMDHIAAETGHSRIDVRRVNMIKPSQIPYKMVCGGTIDSGEMTDLFDMALAKADVAGFAKRKAESAEWGKLRGIGFGMYLEQCGRG